MQDLMAEFRNHYCPPMYAGRVGELWRQGFKVLTPRAIYVGDPDKAMEFIQFATLCILDNATCWQATTDTSNRVIDSCGRKQC